MNKNIEEKLKDIEKEYLDLQEGIQQYANNLLPGPELKKRGSKFGIYEQKGKKMMLRVKAVGGELSIKKFKRLFEIMEEYKIPYLHLSTRQNYQLHEVNFESVKDVIEACNNDEMYFRGGGGNTFRSILINPMTGLDKNDIFDVMPFGRMIENNVFFQDKAFNFGRKLKIGFFSTVSENDEYVMPVQDFGLVAQKINGKSGFKVYSGGGMGRNSRLGKVLIDFLPEEDVLKAITALINLFYDHGNRENRAKARLRFLVEELGFDNYKNLFFEYFNKLEIPNGILSPLDYEEKIKKLKKFSPVESIPNFEMWKSISVKETKYKNVVSVELFVKNGDLSLTDGKNLVKMLEEIGAPLIRASINQNLLIPLVDISALGFIYNYLSRYLPNIVSNNLSPVGQLRACVGCKTCTIGLVDSMGIAEAVGIELEELSKIYPQYQDIIFKESSNIRFSGCGSSCAGIPTAPLGFIGAKKRVGDEIKNCMQVYIGGIMSENIQALSVEQSNNQLLIEEIPQFVKNIFEEYLLSLSEKNLTFAQFMYEKRN